MEKKNMIIIGVVVVIIAILAAVFATGALNNNGPTTAFTTDFMTGSFIGNVEKANTNESFIASYTDKQHNITYNLTTLDNSSALMEIYRFQGVKGPDHRSYNGVDWNIYFGEAMPAVNNTTNVISNQSMGIIICESQQKSQGYVIYAIFSDLNKVNFTLNTFGESYTGYIEPLLKTISLKQSSNVPSVSQEFGLSDDEFKQQIDLIRQVNAGNLSAMKG